MAVPSSSSMEYSETEIRCTTTSCHCCLTEVVPEQVLELVFRRLGNVWDFVRLGAVCRTLHCVQENSSYNGLPLLALQHDNWSNYPVPLECYGLLNYPSSTATTSSHQKLEFVPRVHKKLFETSVRMFLFGSSHGWLMLCPNASFNGLNPNHSVPSIVLLDPLSGHRRPLPYPVSRNERRYCLSLRKMIFSSNPSDSLSPNNNNVIAVALQPTISHYLAFARLGVNYALIEWTLFEEWGKSPMYEDIIFWNEVLYAITWCGYDLVAFDLDNISTPKPRPIIVATFSNPHEKDEDIITNKFLAKLHGDLLLLSISWKRPFYESPWLQIYKLDKSSTSTSTWTQIHRLNGGALFIGERSDSISRLVFSNDQCCIKKNCVYFVRHSAIYVFNLEEGTVTHQDLTFSPSSANLFWLDLIRC